MKNEITIKLTCSINEIKQILEDKGFKVIDKYDIEDIYYIPKDIDVKKQEIKEILKSYILLRKIVQYDITGTKSYNIIKITYKQKDIAPNGDIISQQKYDCEIKEEQQGRNLLTALGYKDIMTIRENGVVYSKDGLDIEVKDVIDSENLIEVECNEKFNTIDKLKQKIIKLNLPIDKSNFFVKKAEIKLKEELGD